MAQILVRDIDPEIIECLKLRAKEHNRSLQGEVKSILEENARSTASASRRPSFEWVGALRDLRDKYTSVELQQETTDMMAGEK